MIAYTLRFGQSTYGPLSYACRSVDGGYISGLYPWFANNIDGKPFSGFDISGGVLDARGAIAGRYGYHRWIN